MKDIMLGNTAVARGLYEAGCRFVSSYPGTPSTEITEAAAEFEAIYAEWAPNEKVALESAVGAGLAGARSFTAMKHVGLNVAADPLYTASYTGVNAGLVIAVADDPGMHSSQNEQDSRHHAMAAKLPMLEPSDSAECKAFTKIAFSISERFDTPVLVRTVTRVAHAQSLVELEEREKAELRPYRKNARKYSMSPANAIARHGFVEQRMQALQKYAETADINRIEWGDKRQGFVTAGSCYSYVKEVFPSASVLKLGIVNPLPEGLIQSFAEGVEELYVIEELDPILETQIRAMGIPVAGGKNLTGLTGELTQERLRTAFHMNAPAHKTLEEGIPVRPPVLCPGCPHRGLFFTLKNLGVNVFGDIGCYTLGGAAPLNAIDTTVCMGASIPMAHGYLKMRPEEAARSVAVIGDSTFMHSGLTGLANVIYNRSFATVLILDNAITGMTGHQQNPTTGLTLKQEKTHAIRMEEVVRALGVERVRIADPADLAGLTAVIQEELAVEAVSVIIVRRPCALLKYVERKPPLTVNETRCRSCKSCMRLGCPALQMRGNRVTIDPSICVGCGLCRQLCRFDAISEEG